MIDAPSDSIVIEFFNQYIMIDGIESFLKVDKDTYCIQIFVKRVTDLFGNTDEGIVGRMLFPETIFVFINAFIFFKETMHPIKN